MEKVKIKKQFKSVYIVVNYGTIWDIFYYLNQAKSYVNKLNEENKLSPGSFQIYKCDINLQNVIQKV